MEVKVEMEGSQNVSENHSANAAIGGKARRARLLSLMKLMSAFKGQRATIGPAEPQVQVKQCRRTPACRQPCQFVGCQRQRLHTLNAEHPMYTGDCIIMPKPSPVTVKCRST